MAEICQGVRAGSPLENYADGSNPYRSPTASLQYSSSSRTRCAHIFGIASSADHYMKRCWSKVELKVSCQAC